MIISCLIPTEIEPVLFVPQNKREQKWFNLYGVQTGSQNEKKIHDIKAYILYI